MIGMKHKLYAAPLVDTVQLIVAKIMTDEDAATDPTNGKDTKVTAGGIVLQIAALLRRGACAEHLVVTVDERAAVADDVETVVRFVFSGEANQCDQCLG